MRLAIRQEPRPATASSYEVTAFEAAEGFLRAIDKIHLQLFKPVKVGLRILPGVDHEVSRLPQIQHRPQHNGMVFVSHRWIRDFEKAKYQVAQA